MRMLVASTWLASGAGEAEREQRDGDKPEALHSR